MVTVWRLRGNIIRTALCWVVWHNVHSQQHTYMSSSYRSSSLGLSHWDPHAVCRGGCLELYYCNMVEWCWWDWSLIWTGFLQCFDTVGLVIWPVKIVPEMTYNVLSGMLSLYTTAAITWHGRPTGSETSVSNRTRRHFMSATSLLNYQHPILYFVVGVVCSGRGV